MFITALEIGTRIHAAMISFDFEEGSAYVREQHETGLGDREWLWDYLPIDDEVHVVIGGSGERADSIESELTGRAASVGRHSGGGYSYPGYRKVQRAMGTLNLSRHQGNPAVMQAVRFAMEEHGFRARPA